MSRLSLLFPPRTHKKKKKQITSLTHSTLSPLLSLLPTQTKAFIFQNRPTSLDILLASHLLLLTRPPFPTHGSSFIAKEVTAFPALVTHADLILGLAFYPARPPPHIGVAQGWGVGKVLVGSVVGTVKAGVEWVKPEVRMLDDKDNKQSRTRGLLAFGAYTVLGVGVARYLVPLIAL